jgi:hypothetical protein
MISGTNKDVYEKKNTPSPTTTSDEAHQRKGAENFFLVPAVLETEEG